MIEVDIPQKEINKLLKDLNKYGEAQEQKTKDNLHESGLKIESDAKMDLTENSHVDTGRLRSSVHWESNTINRNYTNSDNSGNSFNGSLGVNPDKLEIYVGTNVEYADKIRRIDDFLFPYAEKERVQLIRRLKKQLSEA